MKRIGLERFSIKPRRRRHCERSEAIQGHLRSRGLLRFTRNDGSGALARHKASFMADQRGAVAFETLIVYLFLVTSLLLPLADLAAAGFQFVSGWGALRGFGQYVQYNTPPDPTSPSTWISSLSTTTVAGYTISNIQVMCGDANTPCSSGNVTSIPKYYSYTTTVTLAPILLTSVLCTSGNANPCSFTLNYSERFQ